MTAIPLADAFELRGAARRTAAVRALLAAGLVTAFLAAYLLAPGHDLGAAFAAGGRGTVIVLDQSGSIDTDTNARLIARKLLAEVRAAGPHGRVGLVIFSDTALEALPPVAPARALLPFRRFFVPDGRPPPQSAGPLDYPQSPWTSFVGGTSISTGLREALADLYRAGMSGGTVLLVSDLVDSPVDARALHAILERYAHSPNVRLQVRVLPSTLAQPTGLYRRILGPAAVGPARVAPAPPAPAAPAQPLSRWPLGAALLAAVALGLHELLAAPLRWRHAVEEAAA